MKQWFVVQTHARGESLARENLLRQGYEVYLPLYLKRHRHARRTDWIKGPLFPRYLFVLLDPETTPWRAINSTIGAQYIVCFDGRPAPMPEGIIEEIIAREDDKGMVYTGSKVTFNRGEAVRVMSGAMACQTGLFDCAVDDERVFILLNLLGRQVRVKVSCEQLMASA
ncbi:MAG: transcriptional activator RfaH [Rhodospirillales bacterium]|nr:transcriptional activator RfaH [Rhodospirillales bacterium]